MATNQQFNLRWNNHTANILQVFVEQLSNESLVDVTLSCQGQFLKAHKMILSACSPYFQDLFRLHDDKHPVIILNGMKFCDIKMVIEFMYRGEVKVQESELEALLAVAETLQVKGLANVRNKYEKGEIHGVETPAPLNTNSNTPSETQEQEGLTNSSSPPSPSNSGLIKQYGKRKRTPESPKEKTGEKSPRLSKSNKSSKEKSPTKQTNSRALQCVKVTMNDCSDEELQSTIKVGPLFIKDIDEEGSSWDSSNLVIDMEAETEENVNATSTPNTKPVQTTFKTKAQLVKLRPTSELISSSSTSIAAANDACSEIGNSDSLTTASTEQGIVDSGIGKERRGSKRGRIPRPPNAFMIFANEWRRKIAIENPCESNKDISVRLGIKWKSMTAEKKEAYYTASRLADEEHKRKYPNYYYSPMEARIRKSQAQAMRQRMSRNPSGPDLSLENSDAVRYVKIFMKEENVETEENKGPVFLTTVGPDGVDIKTEVPDSDESGHNLEEEFLKLVELRRISPDNNSESNSNDNTIEGDEQDCPVSCS